STVRKPMFAAVAPLLSATFAPCLATRHHGGSSGGSLLSFGQTPGGLYLPIFPQARLLRRFVNCGRCSGRSNYRGRNSVAGSAHGVAKGGILSPTSLDFR